MNPNRFNLGTRVTLRDGEISNPIRPGDIYIVDCCSELGGVVFLKRAGMHGRIAVKASRIKAAKPAPPNVLI